MSEENQTSKNQDNHSNPTSTEDAPEKPEESPSDQVRTLYTILLAVSGVLILLTGILKLDYLLGVFLGCSVVGLNFHWTVVFVRNLIHDKKVQPLNLIFYLTKFPKISTLRKLNHLQNYLFHNNFYTYNHHVKINLNVYKNILI